MTGSIPDNYLESQFEIERVAPNNIRLSHPYINCSELNISSLLKSAQYLDSQTQNELETLISNSIYKLAVQFLSVDSLTTDTLIDVIQQFSKTQLEIKLFDTRNNHLLEFEKIFSLFQSNTLFLADIHDLSHHGLQQIYFGDFTRRIGESYFISGDPFSKTLVKFIHYLSLEYCIVGSDIEDMRVYGCLNWQSPRKSPAVMSNYSEVCGKCIVKWNAIRGLLSLKRRNEEIQKTYGSSPLDILKIKIDCSFDEEDLWKYYQSNPNKAINYILVDGYPKTINELLERSTCTLKSM